LHEESLCKTGDADEEGVASPEECGDEVVNDLVLPDDSPPNLFDQCTPSARELTEQLEIARVVGRFRLRRHAPPAPFEVRVEANVRRPALVRACP